MACLFARWRHGLTRAKRNLTAIRKPDLLDREDEAVRSKIEHYW
jgi:hypothetical protein